MEDSHNDEDFSLLAPPPVHHLCISIKNSNSYRHIAIQPVNSILKLMHSKPSPKLYPLFNVSHLDLVPEDLWGLVGI